MNPKDREGEKGNKEQSKYKTNSKALGLSSTFCVIILNVNGINHYILKTWISRVGSQQQQ